MRKAALACVVLLLAAGTGAARDDTVSVIEKVEKNLLPSVLIKGGPAWTIEERMGHYRVPGLAVAVIEDFEVQWVKGYGVIDSRIEDPVTTKTLFQAASITKPVGAVVALYLVEHGRLDLDEPVNDKLVSWKIPENEFTRVEKVTLRRILTHSAGLTVSGFRGYDVAGGEKVPTILEVLDGKDPANSDPIRVDMVPGTRFRYSGGGYTVMQLLIEDVTGKPLHELSRELVFDPLAMTSSSLEKPLPGELYDRISAGHLRDGTVIEGYWFLPSGSSCCGLWTTPLDLAKFVIELQRSYRGESNKILSHEMTREMLSQHEGENIGLGMPLVDGYGGEVYFSHSGGNLGFSCVILAHREKGYGAAIMTNSDTGGPLYREILRSIAKVYGWKGFLPEEHASVDELIGWYRELKRENPLSDSVSENTLNRDGYEMIAGGNYDAAIAILSLNVEFNPRSANCHDSLAEAYLNSGNREKAVEYYKKALETLDKYPEENARFSTLRESIVGHLEELGELQ